MRRRQSGKTRTRGSLIRPRHAAQTASYAGFEVLIGRAKKVSGFVRKVWTHPANEQRHVAQLLSATRFQLRGRLLHRPTIIDIGAHSKMWARLDSAASILAAYGNPPDFNEWRLWQRHLAPGCLFVDVGANVGTYTLLACDLGASVIAAEPNAENIRRLEENLKLNGYSAEIWPVALTDRSGPVLFTSDLDTENHFTRTPTSSGVTVAGETFDSLIAGRHVHGIKVDVEGAERFVLEGAQAALAAGRIDLLQLEWNGCARMNFGESRVVAREFLAAHGYGLYRAQSNGRLAPVEGEEGTDIFAARTGVAERLM